MHVITWNLQGASHSSENKWNTGVLQLLRDGPKIVCIQEAGSLPPSASLVTPGFGGVAGLNLYRWNRNYILYMNTDPTGNRCNLAIASKNPPTPGAGYAVLPGAGRTYRPCIGAAYPGVGGSVFCLHAISPRGPDVEGLLNAVAASGAAAPQRVFGDFNREPSTVDVGGWAVRGPNRETFSTSNPKHKYDYQANTGGVVDIGQRVGLVASDHYPVSFTI
jgi:cytolethal distending toxin subunit B